MMKTQVYWKTQRQNIQKVGPQTQPSSVTIGAREDQYLSDHFNFKYMHMQRGKHYECLGVVETELTKEAESAGGDKSVKSHIYPNKYTYQFKTCFHGEGWGWRSSSFGIDTLPSLTPPVSHGNSSLQSQENCGFPRVSYSETIVSSFCFSSASTLPGTMNFVVNSKPVMSEKNKRGSFHRIKFTWYDECCGKQQTCQEPKNMC